MKISRFSIALVLVTVGTARQAAADILSADFSTLGTVYQDSAGILYGSSGVGRVDVTNSFQADALAAISLLNHEILIPGWSEVVNFQLASIPGAVADSGINSVDANGRPTSSTIRFDAGGTVSDYIDPNPNPAVNAGFTLTSKNAQLGGGSINVSRFGNAVPGGPAEGRYDAFTVDIHELEHSLGYSSGLDRFLNLVGPSGGAQDRMLLIPKTLTGLPQDFFLPIVPNSAHIDGVVMNGLFNDTVVAEPGFDVGQRALPTAVELYGLGEIEGAAPGQINADFSPAAVPEPSSFLMVTLGLSFVGVYVRRRKRTAAAAA